MSGERITFEGADRVRLAADVGGSADGAAVMLLHGGGQTRHSWGETFERLAAAGYRVVNLDLRGHGESEWSERGDYSLDALSRDILAVVRTLAAPVALVGASLGGISAFAASALAEPGEIAALVMVDIALRPSREGADRVSGFMSAHAGGFAGLDECAAAIAAYNPARPARPGTANLLRNLRQREDGRFYWHWDPAILTRAEPGVLADQHARLIEMSVRVRVPTLLVRGRLSDVVSLESVQELQRFVPQTEFVEIAETGHMIVGDRNEAFSACVLDFLKVQHPVRQGNRT